MRHFLSSDTHFAHSNIIKYCNRPFANVEEMNRVLIQRWNERVKPEDMVYFLGDFCFKKSSEAPDAPQTNVAEYFRKQLNGNIIFIEGNHDRNGRNGLKTKIQGLWLKHGGIQMYCTHKPQIGIADFNLVGHIHEKRKSWIELGEGVESYFINVGVDVHQFYPITLDYAVSMFHKMEREYNANK